MKKAILYHTKSSTTLPECSRARDLAHATLKMSLVKSIDKLIKDRLTAQHEQTRLLTDNQKLLVEKYNDEKLAITLLTVRAELIAYHF